MKKFLATTCLLALGGFFVAVGVGATTATVTSTVTIGTVEVSVDTATVEYGSMPYDESKTSYSVLAGNNITATVGSVVTDLDIRGANTTPDNWALSETNGANQYVHAFGLGVDETTEATSYSALTTTNAVLATGVPATGERYLGLEITTPTSGASAQQSSVVTLTATFGG